MTASYLDTQSVICAVATAPGIGGIGVIRVSGCGAELVVRKLASFLPAKLESHRIYYGYLRDIKDREKIDEVLISYFEKGRSYTGEETFEISGHGSPELLNQIVQNLVKAGARVALPGEFTARAYMSGRFNLVQAEAVLDLIHSQSRFGSKLSLKQLAEGVGPSFRIILEGLNWSLAQVEANIDFAAEDIEIASDASILKRLDEVIELSNHLLSQFNASQMIRKGLSMGLVGAPNSGKSSLLNALVGFDRAIVSPVAGTTRDVVKETLSIDGVPVVIRDTAGLRSTDNEIEREGVMRAKKTVEDVDLVVLVVDSSIEVEDEIFDWFAKIDGVNKLVALNKVDLLSHEEDEVLNKLEQFKAKIPETKCLAVSARTQYGIDELKLSIKGLFEDHGVLNQSVLINTRHFELLSRISGDLVEARRLVSQQESPEFIAMCLQRAYSSALEMTGEEFTEQVLDRVFQEFCLGK